MSVNRSSFYNSFRGEVKNKFDFSSHRKSSTITENEFFKWTSGNMYRTSYNDMANKVSPPMPLTIIKGKSVERKNMVIPKYQGYVPNLKAKSLLAKRYSEQSRDVLRPENIDDKDQTMASTGFNSIYIPKVDDTLNATSRRYGTETMPKTHPDVWTNYKPSETTFRASYINPKRHPSQVYRTRNPDADFS